MLVTYYAFTSRVFINHDPPATLQSILFYPSVDALPHRLIVSASNTFRVIDEIAAGDDFNKNYELFRNIFGAPKG